MSCSGQKRCIVVTCFAEKQAGYLDFSYRMHSLSRNYNLTILSQDKLTQSELFVQNAGYMDMGRKSGKFGWLGYLWKCASYIRKSKPDVIVLLHSSASPITMMVGGIPACLYWNEHPSNLARLSEGFSPIRNFLSKISQELVLSGARHVDLVMPIGEEHYDDLLAHGCKRERVKLVYMGVADAFSGCAEVRVESSDALKLIYAGHVSAERGRDVMLEGMAKAVRSGCNVHLTMVGAIDEQLAYCRRRSIELGIEDNVSVLGRIPGSEIPGALAKADLGICLWEDLPWLRFNPPTKLFEYLAAGLPILASDVRTHTRYVENWGNGLIFEYGAEGLANAIAEMLTHRDRMHEMKLKALQSGQLYLWSRIEPEFLKCVAGVMRA